ncbi:hypothetical protein FA13DRAFT_77821 [Coprinellus micaceus]|uniref:Uncharacterized protein n=1 Tax=Coprinellus micaceus TaxID=71717 RepID=A0A4Y7TJB8_COPMI|nr:hypothetical protein FA13DRAFT_77821 [Coprinellus micaceus]
MANRLKALGEQSRPWVRRFKTVNARSRPGGSIRITSARAFRLSVKATEENANRTLHQAVAGVRRSARLTHLEGST